MVVPLNKELFCGFPNTVDYDLQRFLVLLSFCARTEQGGTGVVHRDEGQYQILMLTITNSKILR